MRVVYFSVRLGRATDKMGQDSKEDIPTYDLSLLQTYFPHASLKILERVKTGSKEKLKLGTAK
jgi:hypothetical protein